MKNKWMGNNTTTIRRDKVSTVDRCLNEMCRSHFHRGIWGNACDSRPDQTVVGYFHWLRSFQNVVIASVGNWLSRGSLIIG